MKNITFLLGSRVKIATVSKKLNITKSNKKLKKLAKSKAPNHGTELTTNILVSKRSGFNKTGSFVKLPAKTA